MAAAATPRRLLALAAVLAAFSLKAVAASPAPRQPMRYMVGGPDGWRVPPPELKEKYYADWAANITFYVDDTIEFVYKNDTAIRIGKAGYYHCNETIPGTRPRDGTTVFVLETPGPAYFSSADLGHCDMGERLMIDVLDPAAAGSPPAPPAPAPWPAAAPGPWSPTPTLLPPAPAPAPSTAAPSLAPSSVAHAVVLVVHVALALVACFV